MPIIDWNQESSFNHPDIYGRIGGYCRNSKEDIMRVCEHHKLQIAINPTSEQKILIVGAGFGWIAESWIESGISSICAVDTSAWIQNNKAENAVIDIYDYDVMTSQGVAAIKQVLNVAPEDKIDLCVTEDIICSYTDQECIELAVQLRTFCNRIVHYTSRGPQKPENFTPELSKYNWKLESEWKQLLSPDQILIIGSTEVL